MQVAKGRILRLYVFPFQRSVNAAAKVITNSYANSPPLIIKEIYYRLNKQQAATNINAGKESKNFYDKLLATLNDEQKELFIAYDDERFMEYGAEREKLFIQEFQTAFPLFCECLF